MKLLNMYKPEQHADIMECIMDQAAQQKDYAGAAKAFALKGYHITYEQYVGFCHLVEADRMLRASGLTHFAKN